MYIAGKIYGMIETKLGGLDANLSPALFTNCQLQPKHLLKFLSPVMSAHHADLAAVAEPIAEAVAEYHKTLARPRSAWGDFGIGYYHGINEFENYNKLNKLRNVLRNQSEVADEQVA